MAEPGVARAVVVANVDPTGAGRIAVRYPGRDDPAATVWARMLGPMAGGQRGIYFPPEIGDEVLVVFDGGDPRHGVVVGGLWSAEQPPPGPAGRGPLEVRQIRTRGGHTLTFDDGASGRVTLALGNGSRLSIDDEQVILQDERGNGLTIRSASGDVTLQASGTITLKASRVSIEASSTTDVKASGALTLKGALVNIN